MKLIKYFLIIPIVLLLMACSKKEVPILTYKQSLNPFVKDISSFRPNIENFKSRYFMPWQISSINIDSQKAKWANIVFKRKNRYYAENTRLWDKEEVSTIIKNTNFEAFNTEKRYAITSKEVQIRNLPTKRPFFKDPELAGEGYGFDYLQNTRLHVNEPLFISHYSKDRAWAFVQTPVSMGWIEVNSLSQISAKELYRYKNSDLLLITKDNLPLYLKNGKYLLHVKLGALLPKVNEDDNFYYSYIIDKTKIEIKIPKENAANFPLSFTQENILYVGSQLLEEKYGWGGFMNNRDCSAMTKDFFQSFGAWLPRNSFGQSKSGHYISLENLSKDEKEKIIAQNARPFQSLLYMKGHIMLYIGQSNDKAMVMHNTWGLKIENDEGEEERRVIGEAIVSDLYLGSNQEGIIEKSLLINNLKGLVVMPINTRFASNPFTKAYPSITSVTKNQVIFDDNTTLQYDDKKVKNTEEFLNNTDIEDMLHEPYLAFEPISAPKTDAGRYRNEDLFKKLYGKNRDTIRKNLVKLTWIDGKTLYFNKKQNAAKQLQKVIEDLILLPKEYQPFITNIAGTYNHRYISGTKRLSAHSFGIAVDLNVKRSAYWKWDKQYNFRNQFPEEIIDIFERHGFIWGGRWYHYDTMHFEYRPEFFMSID